MKRVLILSLLLSIIGGWVFAQGTRLVVGADASLAFPMGEFSKRMKQTNGFSISLREGHYNNARWGGFVDYVRYDDENEDKLFVKRKDTVNNVPRDLVFPLKSIAMSMTAYGAGVTANYNILTTALIDLNGSAGFGIYYWQYDRASYFDSIKVDTGSVTPKIKLIDVIRVPELHQRDWSGGIDIGVEAELVAFSPIVLSAGVRYKIILAELWPTLALDMENVSGIQSAHFTVGLKYIIE